MEEQFEVLRPNANAVHDAQVGQLPDVDSPAEQLQIRSGAVLRSTAPPKKVSPAVTQIHPAAIDEFKNAYNVEFLGLTADHSEADLHDALLRNLGRFLTELGRDFFFVGSQYPVQVGNQDFAIDLVFFSPRAALPCRL